MGKSDTARFWSLKVAGDGIGCFQRWETDAVPHHANTAPPQNHPSLNPCGYEIQKAINKLNKAFHRKDTQNRRFDRFVYINVLISDFHQFLKGFQPCFAP